MCEQYVSNAVGPKKKCGHAGWHLRFSQSNNQSSQTMKAERGPYSMTQQGYLSESTSNRKAVIHPPKGTCKNVHSSTVCARNHPKAHQQGDGDVSSLTTNEQSTTTHNVGVSHRCHLSKTDAKDYFLNNSTYMKYKNRRN